MKKSTIKNTVPGLIALVLLLALGVYLYVRHSAPAGTVSYELRTTSDVFGTTTLPYITKSANPLIAASVNHQIDKIAENNCLSLVPDSGQQALPDWTNNVDTESVYAKNDIFSFSYGIDSYCGGPYPAHGTIGVTFDMKTGHKIDSSTIYEDFDGNKRAIEEILHQAYVKSIKTGLGNTADDAAWLKGCEDLVNLDEGDTGVFEYADYYVTDKGLIMSPSFAHVVQNCSDATLVPLAALKPYLAKGSPLLNLLQ